jgi:BMFP domain-containing protein YqiC
MQKDNKFFEDMAKVASGAAGTFMDMKRDMEDLIAHQLEKLLQNMNLATKEEFETLKDMLAKSRLEQEALKKRLELLEKQAKS